jgi:ferrous iron transport protein B
MSAPARTLVALVGKPNSGKSSLFNLLTGLHQKVGNFPGVTVDKRLGTCRLADNKEVDILDLPGTYSLYPRTPDERIVTEVLTQAQHADHPDRVVVVADATQLKNCLLLVTQLIDLNLPMVLALNMIDLLEKSQQTIQVNKLSFALGVPVVPINARTGQGVAELKSVLAAPLEPSSRQFITAAQTPTDQAAETIARYALIQDLLAQVTAPTLHSEWKARTRALDRWLTHKVWGYVIFFAVLTLIFQSIFAWAQIPMDFIDGSFAQLSAWLARVLPEGPFFDLLTEGLLPGIGGIVIFIPQIAILFTFISLLEESGYMARVVFIMDKVMRRFGLNGKSVVPLISGWACAIPAIMATRTIDSWKDRLITILVTPFMSCSARLPVFTILVALVIPPTARLAFLNLQGVMLMGLYLLGFIAAIGTAWLMKLLINVREKSFLIMELPVYRVPKWSNVAYTLVEKTKSFVFEAGKVILAISIVLWVLASYGPGNQLERAEQTVRAAAGPQASEEEIEILTAAYKLEHSYAGVIGKTFEPVIKPLGYDWKIGIALLTSFAAREVFVGTIATIYSVGQTEDELTIKGKLAAEVNPDTGGPRFTPAVSISLLLFYTFAMQCMSTLAVVKRETKGWRWPLLQLLYMTALAYLSAFIAYQALS